MAGLTVIIGIRHAVPHYLCNRTDQHVMPLLGRYIYAVLAVYHPDLPYQQGDVGVDANNLHPHDDDDDDDAQGYIEGGQLLVVQWEDSPHLLRNGKADRYPYGSQVRSTACAARPDVMGVLPGYGCRAGGQRCQLEPGAARAALRTLPGGFHLAFGFR